MSDQSNTTTISVVSHGQSDDVRSLLKSLMEHESGGRLDILLTENLTTGTLPESAGKEYPGLRIVRNHRPKGFAANHNHAFELAQGVYFCVLNPDVIFVEPVIDHLIRHIEWDNESIVAPLIVNRADQPQNSFRDVPSPMELIQRGLVWRGLRDTSVPGAEMIHPEWIAATFLLMPSKVFADLGGFDENYYLYFEDVDFSCRARLSGLRLSVDPSIRIVHEPRRASRREIRYTLIHARSAIRFFGSKAYKDSLELRKTQ